MDAGASIEYGTLWHAVTDVEYAVLDERFAVRMARWPAVATALLGRTMERARSLAFYLAVCHMTGIEQRLLVVLWHLADRWGRTSRDGVVLRLPITHAVLAGLVGARRPTVTTALARLEENGHVTRERGEGWILHGEPPAELHRIRTQVAG
jgi:CRP-like cAMP-binding protein